MKKGRSMFLCVIMRNGKPESILAKTAGEGLVEVLRYLSEMAPDRANFLSRLVDAARRTKRNHIARHLEAVYPRERSWDNQVIEFVPGFFVGLNNNRHEKERIIDDACQILGLVYGRDVRVLYPTPIPAFFWNFKGPSMRF